MYISIVNNKNILSRLRDMRAVDTLHDQTRISFSGV